MTYQREVEELWNWKGCYHLILMVMLQKNHHLDILFSWQCLEVVQKLHKRYIQYINEQEDMS